MSVHQPLAVLTSCPHPPEPITIKAAQKAFNEAVKAADDESDQ